MGKVRTSVSLHDDDGQGVGDDVVHLASYPGAFLLGGQFDALVTFSFQVLGTLTQRQQIETSCSCETAGEPCQQHHQGARDGERAPCLGGLLDGAVRPGDVPAPSPSGEGGSHHGHCQPRPSPATRPAVGDAREDRDGNQDRRGLEGVAEDDGEHTAHRRAGHHDGGSSPPPHQHEDLEETPEDAAQEGQAARLAVVDRGAGKDDEGEKYREDPVNDHGSSVEPLVDLPESHSVSLRAGHEGGVMPWDDSQQSLRTMVKDRCHRWPCHQPAGVHGRVQ